MRIARHQREDRVERPPDFERPRHLAAFCLQAKRRVEIGGERGRAPDVGLYPTGSFQDLGAVSLDEPAQATAFSGSERRRLATPLPTLVSTIPARMTTMPATMGT